MGLRGREYLLKHLTKDVSVRHYRDAMLSLSSPQERESAAAAGAER